MSCALSIQNLTCKYDQNTTVLESLSLEVAHGEIVCLLGASGCGKTTLLKAVAGLLPLSSGTMSLNCMTIDDGENWTPPEQRNIGMIFQDYALFPHLTVEQNVAFGLKGCSVEEKRSKVAEMLELVHLQDFGGRYPHQLSGGQQQRVAICRALMQEPKILLADEPVASLDPKNTTRIMEALQQVSNDGIAVMVNLHSIELVKQYCTRVIGLEKGKVVYDGAPDGLTDDILQSCVITHAGNIVNPVIRKHHNIDLEKTV
mgnify:CR=1 FL=1